MKNEAAFVNSLSTSVSAPLPHYEFVSRENSKDFQPFAGYRKLEGVPCSPRDFRKSWTEKLGPSLGKFLTKLHSVDASDQVLRHVERFSPQSWVARYRERHREVRKFAYPFLNRVERARSERVWSALHSELNRAKLSFSLIHDDLMGQNILADPHTGNLSGILDWSDAKIGEPANDFAGLMSVNRQLGELALESYQRERSGLKHRAQLYLQYLPLGEVAWGASQGSKHIIRVGLNDFRRWTMPTQ